MNQERKAPSNPTKTRKAQKAIRPKNRATKKIKRRRTKKSRALQPAIKNQLKTPLTTSRSPNQAKRVGNPEMKKVNKLGPPKPPRAKVSKMIRLAA